MDGGAAAPEKNGANNLEEHDRDNRIPEPIPQPNPNRQEKPPSGFGEECTQTIRQVIQKSRQEALDSRDSFREGTRTDIDTLGKIQQIPGTPVREEGFTLDPTGNWAEFWQDDKGDGTWDLKQQRDHNHVNEIDTDDVHGDADNPITETTGTAWADPVYDAAGNMTTVPRPWSLGSARTVKYDAWNRLTDVFITTGGSLRLKCEYL